MNTPLFSAVEEYLSKDMARFHMPGHKGVLPAPFDAAAPYDITEVQGCDSLYEASGAIAGLEQAYAALYGAGASLLSAGGSTLCIQAMLALAAGFGGKVVAGRGSHAAAVNAMALLDITPVWAYPETDKNTGLAKAVSPDCIRNLLQKHPGAAAVYITSPDYYGVLCDIAAIAAVCREYAVPLLVDNAHGAHLKFLESPLHPMDLGAAMCCDSLHKTLPVLTGGAMLHIRDERYIPRAKRWMSVFGSTSPGYLTMLSADRALSALRGDFPGKLREAAAKVSRLKELARARGFALPEESSDPLRLTLGFGAAGYPKEEFAGLIRAAKIEPEYISGRFCVLMASPCNTPEDFARLEKFVKYLPAKPPLPFDAEAFDKPIQAKSLREALFSETARISVEEAPGRVAGGMVVPCPPGIPIVMPGERIGKKLPPVLKKYGISQMDVLK